MSSTSSRPPSTDRGARARAAILTAAREVFAVHGYRAGSLAAVAARAKMTQPGLLHHFPSKDHLLMEVLEERDRDNIRRMQAGTWHEGGTASLRALQDLVAHNATVRDEVQMFAVLVGEGLSRIHPAHAFFVERYAFLRYHITRSLQRGQDAGEIRADVDPAMVACLLMAAMDGLQVQWLLDEDIAMPPRFELFIDMIVNYVAVET
jgi:AcrR family transcriptional regulator